MGIRGPRSLAPARLVIAGNFICRNHATKWRRNRASGVSPTMTDHEIARSRGAATERVDCGGTSNERRRCDCRLMFGRKGQGVYRMAVAHGGGPRVHATPEQRGGSTLGRRVPSLPTTPPLPGAFAPARRTGGGRERRRAIDPPADNRALPPDKPARGRGGLSSGGNARLRDAPGTTRGPLPACLAAAEDWRLTRGGHAPCQKTPTRSPGG